MFNKIGVISHFHFHFFLKSPKLKCCLKRGSFIVNFPYGFLKTRVIKLTVSALSKCVGARGM